MDKYLKMFEPPMKKWLAEHYSPEEASLFRFLRFGRPVLQQRGSADHDRRRHGEKYPYALPFQYEQAFEASMDCETVLSVFGKLSEKIGAISRQRLGKHLEDTAQSG